MTRSSVIRHDSGSSGAVGCGDGSRGSITISDCVIDDARSTVFTSILSTSTVSDVTVTFNRTRIRRANSPFTAIWLRGNSRLLLSDSEISSCASVQSAAIAIDEPAQAELRGSRFEFNTGQERGAV